MPQPVNPEDQPDGTYRLSRRAIRIWTRLLIAVMVVGVVAAIALFVIAGVNESEFLAVVSATVLGSTILLPLLLGAYLGGESLARFGGLVGIALVAGMVLGAAGWVLDSWFGWLGLGLMLVATFGFFVLGFHRGVPMSIGGVHVHPRRPRDLLLIGVGILGAGAMIASSWVGIWLLIVGFLLEAVPITWASVAEHVTGENVARARHGR